MLENVKLLILKKIDKLSIQELEGDGSEIISKLEEYNEYIDKID